MRLTIYSKPGCHLCDEMKATISLVVTSRPDITVDEVDISTDPALVERYGLEIPVLMIEGRKIAKYRISEEELTKRLAKSSTGSQGSLGS